MTKNTGTIDIILSNSKIYLAVVKHRFEMHVSTYMWFYKVNIRLALCIPGCGIHWTNQIKNGIFCLRFWESTHARAALRYLQAFDCAGIDPNHCTVQGSTLHMCQDHTQHLKNVRFVIVQIKMLQRSRDQICTGYALCQQWKKQKSIT